MSLLHRLGWRHRGFRADSRGAMLALCILIGFGFVVDQLTSQLGLRVYPDLALWRHVAADFLNDPGQPLYERHPEYVYPPFFLTFVRPLADVPERLAAFIYQALKWLAILLSLRLAWRLCSPPGEDVPPVVALGSLVLTGRFIWNDVSHGNINSFLLLAVLGGFWLLLRGRPYLAGAAVGAAACVKLTPALVLVYFVYKRQWRPLPAAAVAAVIVLLIWPALWIGWANNWQGLVAWYHHVVATYMPGGELWSIYINQSLPAVINRLLGPDLAIDPDTYIAITILPPGVRLVIRLLLSAGIVVAVAWLCRGRLPASSPSGAATVRERSTSGAATVREPSPLALAAEISLVQITMLLLSGFSWKAHFVALLLPYTVLLAWLADARYTGPRRLVSGLLATSFVLCTLSGTVLGRTAADYAEAYGLITLGAMLAAAGIGVIRSRLRRATAGSVQPPDSAALMHAP